MNPWSKSDFTKEAKRIAEAFIAGDGRNGATMTDLLEKSARDNALLPEQICRLTRMANTLTFNEKSAAMAAAGEPDRHVEFLRGDEDAVISRLSPTREATKIASELYPDLPDVFAAARGEVLPSEPALTVEKVAEQIRNEIGRESPVKLLAHWEKVAEELTSRKLGMSLRWEDSMGVLVEYVKTSGIDSDEFEDNALALHGHNIVPELQQLRRTFKLAEREFSLSKIAHTVEHVEGRVSIGTSAVKTAADARVAYLQHTNALEIAERNAKHFRGVCRG
jgi:hypothetical protein